MTVRDDVIAAVPVGAAHKKTARAIWENIGQWAHSSVKHNLNLLSYEHAIVRTVEPFKSGELHLFHKVRA